MRILLRFAASLILASFAACGTSPDPAMSPLDRLLPSLPEAGGAVKCAAGRLTEQNFAAERAAGPASQGLVGDFFMRNDRIRVVIQAPGRDIGVVPYGGNLIDADFVDVPRGDQIGEVAPFLQLGRTVEWTRAEVVRDGSGGGIAALRFYGKDAIDSFINITGLGSFTKAIGDDYRAFVELHLEAAVTYVLAPGATHLEALFTFYNPGDTDVTTSYGSITDTGAHVETFHPGPGFGEASINDVVAPKQAPPPEYFGLQGEGIAYGVVPISEDKKILGAGLAISGVDVELYGVKGIAEAFGSAAQTLVVPAAGGAQRVVDVFVGNDLGDVERAVRLRKGDAPVAVKGVVLRDDGMPAAGARVIAEDAAADPMFAVRTAFVTDGKGGFSGALAAGSYRFQAEGENFLRGAATSVTLAANAPPEVKLTVPYGAPIDWKVHDRAGNPLAAKIVIVGPAAAAPDRRFREVTKENLPLGVAAWQTSLDGDSSKGTRWDRPIRLPAGRYRFVASHGPEWSRFEKTFDLTSQGASFDATLDRVLDTAGYVASDFHQHTYYSPDAPVPPMDRVAGYLADAVEMVATTEHDFHYDLAPVVKMLGGERLLTTMVGVEVTPFSYGHFIAYPMDIDPLSPSGGALAWTFDPMTGLDQSPGEIFAGLRKRGARVVQMNHPRVGPSDTLSSFQQNFDRAGLTYDFATRSFGGSEKLMPLKAVELGLADGADLFSPEFDTLEIYNGVGFQHLVDGDRRLDGRTEYVMRDWMNFLSFGFTPTALGNSDSHDWFAAPPGTPRSMVRVKDDGPAAIQAGLADEVVRALKGEGVPRDVVVTNAPMMAFSVDGKGIGETVAHGMGPLAISIRVQAPSWAEVDTIEVFANSTFDIPEPKGSPTQLLTPVVCFTSRMLPTQRCSGAVGGARPLAWSKVEATPGGGWRWDATVTAMVDAADLLARQRAGAVGRDLWMVARATGDVGLFPFIPGGIADPAEVARLVEGQPLDGLGVPSLAFTNPIFVDVDGGGWRAPFAH